MSDVKTTKKNVSKIDPLKGQNLSQNLYTKELQNKKCRIFSFFSGSGFLDLGFETSGFDIAFINEFLPAFYNAYFYARHDDKHSGPDCGSFNGDINSLLEDKIFKNTYKSARLKTEIIGFIGGPPCPDFSVAGKNKGRSGVNGQLSQSYVDMICSYKPDFFLFENVKGLWKTAKHRAYFEELKKQLHSVGYATTEKLVNALEFGVPQDRERILLFGILKSKVNKPYKNKNELLGFPWESHTKYQMSDILNCSWPTTTKFSENSIIKKPENILEDLTVEYWFNKNDVLHHPNANDYLIPRGGLPKMQTVMEGDVSKKCYKRLHRWRYSPTAAYGNNEVHLHPYKIRRLSVSEVLAIQSLPKDFCLPPEMALTAKFKTVGNGVPYLLAKGIAETIHDYLGEAL